MLAITSTAAWGSLLDSPDSPRRDEGCTVTVNDGVAVIEVHEGQMAAVEWQLRPVGGPASLRFRLKTAVNGDDGEYIAYWMVAGEQQWKSFRRIPFHADGEWHDYHLPLADCGQLTALRLSFGKQRHRVKIAGIEVAATDRMLPDHLEAARNALPPRVDVAAGSLRCQLNCQTQVFVIDDDATGRAWTSEPISAWLSLCGIDRVSEDELRLVLFDFHAQKPLTATVKVTAQCEVRFSMESSDPLAPIAAASQFPPRFTTAMDNGRLIFCDRSCGVLLAQNDPAYAAWPLRVYGNTHGLSMPWIGLYDNERGDGVMLLVETPTDAEVALIRDDKGRHWPEIRWLASMDGFGGRRTASLRFTNGGGYVRLAKSYRERLERNGQLKTLREKALAKPHVERLRGAAVLWGGDSAGKFLDEMQPLGIEHGVVNGCEDAPTIARLNEQGYLTGRYDSYTDILSGELGFQRDDVEAAAVRSRPGGSPKRGWLLESGDQMYWRSSARWSNAERAYVDQQLKALPYNARFIDVAAAAELLEDYHPQHSMTRGEDLTQRRALFARMNDRRIVLGTEHGNDWVADQVEYVEGAMSGPFWWSSWPAGYLTRPTREQLSPEYLKFGIGYAHRIPLWDLVYHDCAISTWYWGDTAGMLFEAAPELADRKDLLNILYGTPPLIWMDGRDYRYPADVHRMLRTYHDTCPLHQVVAFEEMVDHEFLSADLAVQRTRFGDGTVAAVNFGEEPKRYEDDDGGVVLAPRGFYVTGPGIRQCRLWIDNAPQTVIAKDGYLTVEGDGKASVEGVRANGRLTLFRLRDSRWNLLVEPDVDVELDVRTITGWNATRPIQLHSVEPGGNLGPIIGEADRGGIVRLRSTQDAWQFAIIRTAASQTQRSPSEPD